MRTALKLAMVILAIAGSAARSTAQLPVFRNYNTQDGLPSSETYCVEQDSRGYIYIGTDRGLTRFDGRRFETLTTQDGLVNNTIFSLATEGDKLWYYTFSSLVGYLRQDTAYEYAHNPIVQEIMRTGVASTVAPEKNGRLFLNRRIPFLGYELVSIAADGSTDRSKSVPFTADYAHIYVTDGHRWIRSGPAHAKKIKLFSLPNGRLLQEFEPDRSSLDPLVPLCGYRKGNTLWLLYKDVYMLQGDIRRKLISCPGSALYMLVDREENIWLGFQNKGVVLYRKKDNYRKAITLLEPYSVSGALEDREGGLWFTTLENGVYYLPPGFLPAYDSRTGLSPAKTTQIRFAGDRTAALQSDFALFIRDNKPGAPWKQYFAEYPVSNIVSLGRQLYMTDIKNRWRTKPPAGYARIPHSKLLFAGRYLWAGGSNLYAFDPKSNEQVKILSTGLPVIVCLQELPDSSLLLGALDGLYLFRNDNLYKLPLNKAAYRERVSDIQQLDSGHLLIATSGQGILVLDKAFRVVRHIAVQGPKNTICNVVRCDTDGVVWAGTNRGLYRIGHILDPDRTQLQWADIHDGINSNEINDICIIGPDLWLATAKGISIFPRNKKLTFTDSIPVLIQKLTVNGRQRRTEAHMKLPYGKNTITISFIGLNFRYADVLRYRYRLQGAGKESWNYTVEPVINYNSLPPGDYIFEYGAMAPNQSGKIHTGSLHFTIAPPFWRTWWFMVSGIMVTGFCIFLFIHYRVRAIRNQVRLKTDLRIYRDKALRDQMSPHFIYNSLNTIQHYILKHDTAMSVSFLSKFSRLMRLTFNNTGEDTITLQKDLEALQLYTEMESMRFPGKLVFHLPEQLPEELRQAHVPPLLLQPFVENSVLHGLLPKNAPGNIWLAIEEKDARIFVSIKDDGIGRQAAAKIRSKKKAFLNPESREQSGTTITIARIAQAWEKLPAQSDFRITDLFHTDGSPSGTLIQFYLPLNHDKSNYS